ncbi:MAG: hypothetical protein ACK4M3_04330 [Pyrobaculum sp.]
MCPIEKLAVKKGLTLSTARWICELAKELGVREKRLFRAIRRLAKEGVWLEGDDWRELAKSVDLSKHLELAIDYILRRVSTGLPPVDAVRELPKAVERAGKLAHIREVLSNLF